MLPLMPTIFGSCLDPSSHRFIVLHGRRPFCIGPTLANQGSRSIHCMPYFDASWERVRRKTSPQPSCLFFFRHSWFIVVSSQSAFRVSGIPPCALVMDTSELMHRMSTLPTGLLASCCIFFFNPGFYGLLLSTAAHLNSWAATL